MNVDACRIKYLQIVSFLEIEENTRHCVFINISSYYDQLLRSKSIQVHEYFRFVSKTLFEFRSTISRVNDSRVKLARVEARRTSRGGIEPRSVSIVGEIIFHRRGEKSGCSRRGKDSRDACWSLRFAYESHGFLASIDSLSLSRLAENSSPFRREGKRWRCCLGRFRAVNTINEGALNGCTSSREAEKGDGGILGIARLPSGAICMCNWMLDALGVVWCRFLGIARFPPRFVIRMRRWRVLGIG